MYELGVCYRNTTRADKDVADQLGQYGCATVHEALGRVGLLQPYICALFTLALKSVAQP